MTVSETPAAARRGRPRSASSEQAIMQAALDLLAEGLGPASLSIAAIARRAGAGKDTIYRRWQTKEDLLIEALSRQVSTPEITPEMSLREALVSHLSETITRMQDVRNRRIMRSLQGAGDDFPTLRERYYDQVVRRRHAVIEAQVKAAIARGEIADTPALRHAVEMPFHHVLMRALEDHPVAGDPVEAATELVAIALTGVASLA